MEFTTIQQELREKLAYAVSVVERKSTIPVLQNVLIETVGASGLKITGTDLDIAITVDVKAKVTTPGSICVAGGKLFDIVRAVESPEITFKSEANDWVKINAGRAKFRIAGVKRDQFPKEVTYGDTRTVMSGEILADMIAHTSFCITTETSRFTLSGAKLEVSQNTARMVTTDGHRLAIIEAALPDDPERKSLDCLVPKKALLAALKAAREAEEDISLAEDPHHIFFRTGGLLIVARKLSGAFPNYQMVIPKDAPHSVEFDLEPVRNAIKRIALVTDERTQSMYITLAQGEMTLKAKGNEDGEGHEILPAEYAGDEITLGFNYTYLLQCLNAIATGGMEVESEEELKKGSKMAMCFTDANAQTVFRLAGEAKYDYKYVIMPLRI